MSKLESLRSLLKQQGIDALVIPTEDDHQSEYIAGTAVVLADKALLWTDGRYFLQATNQLSSDWTLMKDRLPTTPSIADWLGTHFQSPATIAFDPKTSPQSFRNTLRPLVERGHSVRLLEQNLIDSIWADQPPAPSQPLLVQEAYAGHALPAKLASVQSAVAAKADAFAVFALDEIAWLFNIRGNDIAYNPVAIAYALVGPGLASLYVDASKVTDAVREHLQSASVTLFPYEQFFPDLVALGKASKAVWLDPSSSVAIFSSLPQSSIREAESPISLMKALKNDVELEGIRQCHIRDAAAKVRYFAWLEGALHAGETVTECSGADKLEWYRSQGEHFVSLSFDTISGSGSNGAIIHYKPETETCATITLDKMYLCDSGGQYRDGTTDVTRTVHFGQPSDEEKDRFTRVLKGHIALGLAVFPPAATGKDLDVLARLPLWEVGLDFGHGTGHGVGAFLNVHEGPQGINRRTAVSLQKGMTITNEPGYYEAGKFGIRIENVMIVTEANTPNKSDITYLTFDNMVTLVPICKKLIVPSMLSDPELNWLNAFHATALIKLSPLLANDPVALEWLKRETTPLSR